MKRHEISLTSEQAGELAAPVLAAVLATSPARAQYWIGRKRKLFADVLKLLEGNASGIPWTLESWLNLYKEEFGIELDLNALVVPELRPEAWLVVADERIMNNQVYDACARHFPCWKYTDDLNKIRNLHLTGTTCRLFKATVEADEDQKNRSANGNEKAGLTPRCIALKERLLLELWYSCYNPTTRGKHLDISNWTRCDGSRGLHGRVPGVGWRGGSMDVRWCDPIDRGDYVRARVAIS